MGKYSDKYPGEEWAVYADAEEAEEVARIEERDMLLDREENFQRELLNRKLECIDGLSNSISKLADSIIASISQPRQQFNIIITPDTSVETIDHTMKQLKESFTN